MHRLSNKMREDEIRVAELISQYLSSIYFGIEVNYLPGENPPDAYQLIGNEIYPLEITSTEVDREPIFGIGKIRERTYEASHRAILRDVQEEFIEEDNFIGKYAISFSKPLADHDFSTYRSLFIEKLKQVLFQLSSAPVGSDATVEHEYESLAWVYKLSDKGLRLYDVFQDGGWIESPEFLEFFYSLITKAIDTKIEKLSNSIDLSRYILAIRNTYRLADMNTLISTRARFADKKLPFHTVFVVHGEQVFAIKSQNSDWIVGAA